MQENETLQEYITSHYGSDPPNHKIPWKEVARILPLGRSAKQLREVSMLLDILHHFFIENHNMHLRIAEMV